MLNNERLVFFASAKGKALYSRDSIKRDYNAIIKRFNSLNVLVQYLEKKPEAALDIYYFDNNGVNEYNIKSVSGQYSCGRLGFDHKYLSKSILFEIRDGNNVSLWFLLPDNKMLLYIQEGENALNFDYKDFGEDKYFQYPCVVFDGDGNRITVK